MSVASTAINIQFTKSGSTLSARLVTDKGDLYQFWEGGYVAGVPAPSIVYPDYSVAANTPTITMVCTSSNVADGAGGRLRPSAVRWYFGATLISFDAQGYSTGIFRDTTLGPLFQQIDPATGQTDYSLKILRSVAAEAGYQSVDIRCEADLTIGASQTPTQQASLPILIRKESAAGGPKALIESRGSSPFQIVADGGTCRLACVVRDRGNIVPSTNYDYKWFVLSPSAAGADPDGWLQVGANSDTYDAQDDQIATYGEFRCLVYAKPGAGQTSFADALYVSGDICAVYDMTDDFDILVEVTSAGVSAQQRLEAGVCEEITITPHVVSRNDPSTYISRYSHFTFLVRDSEGNALNKWRDGNAAVDSGDPMEYSTKTMASYTVTLAQAQQAGGDLTVIINAYGQAIS